MKSKALAALIRGFIAICILHLCALTSAAEIGSSPSPIPTPTPNSCDGQVSIIASASGTFFTSNTADKYIANIHCSWVITAPANHFINIEFESFLTEKCCDPVRIFNGTLTANGDEPVLDLRGPILTPYNVAVHSPSVVTFDSDDIGLGSGFTAYAYAVLGVMPSSTPSPTWTPTDGTLYCKDNKEFLPTEQGLTIIVPKTPGESRGNGLCTFLVNANHYTRIKIGTVLLNGGWSTYSIFTLSSQNERIDIVSGRIDYWGPRTHNVDVNVTLEIGWTGLYLPNIVVQISAVAGPLPSSLPTPSPAPWSPPGICQERSAIAATTSGTFFTSSTAKLSIEKIRCNWIITAPANHFIRIQFSFHLLYNNYVQVFDGLRTDGVDPVFTKQGPDSGSYASVAVHSPSVLNFEAESIPDASVWRFTAYAFAVRGVAPSPSPSPTSTPMYCYLGNEFYPSAVQSVKFAITREVGHCRIRALPGHYTRINITCANPVEESDPHYSGSLGIASVTQKGYRPLIERSPLGTTFPLLYNVVGTVRLQISYGCASTLFVEVSAVPGNTPTPTATPTLTPTIILNTISGEVNDVITDAFLDIPFVSFPPTVPERSYETRPFHAYPLTVEADGVWDIQWTLTTDFRSQNMMMLLYNSSFDPMDPQANRFLVTYYPDGINHVPLFADIQYYIVLAAFDLPSNQYIVTISGGRITFQPRLSYPIHSVSKSVSTDTSSPVFFRYSSAHFFSAYSFLVDTPGEYVVQISDYENFYREISVYDGIFNTSNPFANAIAVKRAWRGISARLIKPGSAYTVMMAGGGNFTLKILSYSPAKVLSLKAVSYPQKIYAVFRGELSTADPTFYRTQLRYDIYPFYSDGDGCCAMNQIGGNVSSLVYVYRIPFNASQPSFNFIRDATQTCARVNASTGYLAVQTTPQDGQTGTYATRILCSGGNSFLGSPRLEDTLGPEGVRFEDVKGSPLTGQLSVVVKWKETISQKTPTGYHLKISPGYSIDNKFYGPDTPFVIDIPVTQYQLVSLPWNSEMLISVRAVFYPNVWGQWSLPVTLYTPARFPFGAKGRAVSVTQTSASMVSAPISEGTLPITQYKAALQTDYWPVNLNFLASNGNIPVTCLFPNTPYLAQVWAVNPHAASVNRLRIKFTTLSGPPVNVTATALSSAHWKPTIDVKVQWNAPSGAGVILHYTLKVVDLTDMASWKIKSEGSGTSFIIHSLVKGREYNVSVSATNGAGAGPFSQAQSLTGLLSQHAVTTILPVTDWYGGFLWSSPLQPEWQANLYGECSTRGGAFLIRLDGNYIRLAVTDVDLSIPYRSVEMTIHKGVFPANQGPPLITIPSLSQLDHGKVHASMSLPETVATCIRQSLCYLQLNFTTRDPNYDPSGWFSYFGIGQIVRPGDSFTFVPLNVTRSPIQVGAAYTNGSIVIYGGYNEFSSSSSSTDYTRFSLYVMACPALVIPRSNIGSFRCQYYEGGSAEGYPYSATQKVYLGPFSMNSVFLQSFQQKAVTIRAKLTDSVEENYMPCSMATILNNGTCATSDPGSFNAMVLEFSQLQSIINGL